MSPLISSTQTTLQILWDAALAYYILQASAVYAALALIATAAFSHAAAAAHVAADFTSAPALAAALVAAVLVMRGYCVPRQIKLRVAIGLVAVGLARATLWAGGWERGRTVQWVGLAVWPVVDTCFHGRRGGEKTVSH